MPAYGSPFLFRHWAFTEACLAEAAARGPRILSSRAPMLTPGTLLEGLATHFNEWRDVALGLRNEAQKTPRSAENHSKLSECVGQSVPGRNR